MQTWIICDASEESAHPSVCLYVLIFFDASFSLINHCPALECTCWVLLDHIFQPIGFVQVGVFDAAGRMKDDSSVPQLLKDRVDVDSSAGQWYVT